MILNADKGRFTVVMNKNEYIEKCHQLLNDTNDYKVLKADLKA